jgi:hypothetical protein
MMIGWVYLGLRRGRGSIERLGRLWGCSLGGSVKVCEDNDWSGVGGRGRDDSEHWDDELGE